LGSDDPQDSRPTLRLRVQKRHLGGGKRAEFLMLENRRIKCDRRRREQIDEANDESLGQSPHR
jgi:hypothetical protein